MACFYILPNLELADINSKDIDIPIAKRKWVRTCAQHPIERYVSCGKLSQKYKSFVAVVDSVEISRNIQEIL